jgi:hypothetical protein
MPVIGKNPNGKSQMKSIVIGLSLLLGISAPWGKGSTPRGEITGSAALVRAGREHGGQLENTAIAWHWQFVDGKLRPAEVDDKLNGVKLPLGGDCFELVLGDGTVLKSSDFTLAGTPVIEDLRSEPDSPVLARHFPGRQLVAKFSAPDRHLVAEWRVILRSPRGVDRRSPGASPPALTPRGEGASYVRQKLALRVIGQDVLIKEIVLFQQTVPGAKTVGTVEGSPVVAGDFFFGYEQPMSQNTVSNGDVVRCSFQRDAVLKRGETLTQSCVVGVVPPGQLRRGFLAYLERERPRPYRPFLHYNTWYDIAWDPAWYGISGTDHKFNERECLDVVNQICRELVDQRGVKMDSFLFDDGWDDDRSLWQFNPGFPDGFTPLRKAAAKYHAGIGVWLSPFGGYGQAKAQRLEYGSRLGFETNAFGFSLAGPKYYARFRDICLEMVRKYGVNTFKFDGLSAGAKAGGNGLTRDGDAMLRLIADLRAAEPGIYINQTTGTWPSPFWLLYVDSTWRGGDDHSFAGQGSWCQRWMTYRDEQTYHNIVARAPLYPLNSLMPHGILYARYADHLNQMSDADFADQVREYFGNGTQLQELYITPELLDKQNWDDLAEAAKWARANADVLVDTHWIGGNPAKGQIYGWASWSPRPPSLKAPTRPRRNEVKAGKAILVLRNPDDRPAAFTADVKDLLQLPPHARTNYLMHSPWEADREQPAVELEAGKSHTFNLQPFEVLVLEEIKAK